MALSTSLQAQWFSFIPHLKDAAINSVCGTFNKVTTLPKRLYLCFNPMGHVQDCKVHTEVTHESADATYPPLYGVSAELTHDLINRTNTLAKLMGIHQNIRIFPTADAPQGLGSTFSKEVVIFVTKELPHRPQEEIDFVLARELTHVLHNHFVKETGIKACILAADILVGTLISPLAIPFCEFIASPLENFANRRKEMDADQGAMDALNTSAGAVSFFSERMDYFKALKAITPSCPKEQKKREYYISACGDNRLDIVHPPFSERLANAQSFQPQSVETVSID
jgi:Zn-dependent protease with chaperone function